MISVQKLFWLAAAGLVLSMDAHAAPAAAPAGGFVPPKTVPSSVMRNWPDYSAESKAAGHQGVTLLGVTISATGAPADIKIVKSSGFAELDAAAVAAVRKWSFEPARRDGVPIEATVNLPVNFKLKAADAAPAAAAAAPAVPAPAKPKPKPAKAKPAEAKPDAPAEQKAQ